MPRMNSAEMASPSGCSMMFATSAYARTSVRMLNPTIGRGLRCADRGYQHGEGGRDHHREDPGRVGACLGIDVGLEPDGDQDADRRVDEHDGSDGAAPFGGHAVGGQVARHDVDQPGHRGCAGEPQDQDGADVVDRAESVAEELVRQVGQRPTVGLAARLERLGRDEERGDEAAGQQVHAHDRRGEGQELARVADPGVQPGRCGLALGGDKRHHAHPGLESGQPEHQQRERDEGRQEQPPGLALRCGEGGHPVCDVDRMGRDLHQPRRNDDGVQGEEDGDERYRDVHRFGEAQEEHAAEHQQQHDGDGDRLPGQGLRHERVLQEVHGRVSGGEGDGDDPRGGDEAEQDQDEDLPLPERKQSLEHRDRPLSVRALLGHSAVHRQHAEQRQRDDQQASPAARALRRRGRRSQVGRRASRSSRRRSGTSPSTRRGRSRPPPWFPVRQVARCRGAASVRTAWGCDHSPRARNHIGELELVPMVQGNSSVGRANGPGQHRTALIRG